MSHFTVVVVGDDYEEQLAPYHEFECTGRDDEYVIDVDRTEETRREYEEQTSAVCKHKETGEIVSRYDERFYRLPNAQLYPSVVVENFRTKRFFKDIQKYRSCRSSLSR